MYKEARWRSGRRWRERVQVYERRAEEAKRQTQRTQESVVEALRVEANRAYEAQQQLAEVRGQQEAVEAAKMTAEAWANAGSRWMPTIMQHFPPQPAVVEKPPPPPKVARVEAPLSCPPELLHPVCSASTEAYGNARNAAGVWLRESGLGSRRAGAGQLAAQACLKFQSFLF